MGSNNLAFKTWLKDDGPYVVHDLKDFNGTRIGEKLHYLILAVHVSPSKTIGSETKPKDHCHL